MPRHQYPFEVYGLDKIIEDGLDVEDLKVKDLLLYILAELRSMNEHLTTITDEEIDIDEPEV